MSRKKVDFVKLFEYMEQEAEPNTRLSRNLYDLEKDSILNAYQKNFEYLEKRKNGNSYYHEIISLEKNEKIPKQRQKQILYDLANKYLEKRAGGHLCYGVVHNDREHLHAHLMISSNEKYSEKRKRLSKREYGEIQKELEEYRLEKYPELETERLFDQERKRKLQSSKSADREYRQKLRTGEESRSERVKRKAGEALALSYGEKDFIKKLRQSGLEYYKRGNTAGVIDLEGQEQGKKKCKYRLKRLGLDIEFAKILEMERRKEQEEEYERERDFDLER